MKLSSKTVAAIMTRWTEEGIVTDYASEYGEPGYDFHADVTTPMVVLGDWWCKCDKVLHAKGHPREGQPALHDYGYHWPKLMEQLVDQGVDMYFYDEWIIDHENDKAYRTTDDSYHWQQVWRLTDDGEMLTPDDDIDAWLEYAVNDHRKVLPAVVGTDAVLTEHGFTQHNGQFESGWFQGQDAKPEDVVVEITRWADGPVDVVIVFSEASQFYVGFTAWYRDAFDNDDKEAEG